MATGFGKPAPPGGAAGGSVVLVATRPHGAKDPDEFLLALPRGAPTSMMTGW